MFMIICTCLMCLACSLERGLESVPRGLSHCDVRLNFEAVFMCVCFSVKFKSGIIFAVKCLWYLVV